MSTGVDMKVRSVEERHHRKWVHRPDNLAAIGVVFDVDHQMYQPLMIIFWHPLSNISRCLHKNLRIFGYSATGESSQISNHLNAIADCGSSSLIWKPPPHYGTQSTSFLNNNGLSV
jgi:hypothetical protein